MIDRRRGTPQIDRPGSQTPRQIRASCHEAHRGEDPGPCPHTALPRATTEEGPVSIRDEPAAPATRFVAVLAGLSARLLSQTKPGRYTQGALVWRIT